MDSMERSQERRSWVAELSTAVAMLVFAEIMYSGLQGEREVKRRMEKGLGTEKPESMLPASLLGPSADLFRWTTRSSSPRWVTSRRNRTPKSHFVKPPIFREQEAALQWWQLGAYDRQRSVSLRDAAKLREHRDMLSAIATAGMAIMFSVLVAFSQFPMIPASTVPNDTNLHRAAITQHD